MREYSVETHVCVEYLVDAESAQEAMAIVRTYSDHELSHPAQALELISVEHAECFEETLRNSLPETLRESLPPRPPRRPPNER